MRWWSQFPAALRLITRVRFLASFGAGGVIFLTPLVFNQISFTATQVGIGIAAAAGLGTFARFLSGGLLDRKVSSTWIVLVSCLLFILADGVLFFAKGFDLYLKGQLLIGLAAGLYWPAVELAVPFSCVSFSSRRGFALVRSADALGMSLGTFMGSIAASLSLIRSIYIFDCFCMLFLVLLLTRKPLNSGYTSLSYNERNSLIIDSNHSQEKTLSKTWLISLIPILVISITCTGIFSLLQSALPLDLVRGGISRPPLSEGLSGSIITIQLWLLVLLQWPVGTWMSRKSLRLGLILSLISLGFGCLIVAYSSLIYHGAVLLVLSQLLFAIGLAAFLPTATQAVIEGTPSSKRGIAMALFSQCFAITALASPVVAGRLLDSNGHLFLLWLSMFALCIIALPCVRFIQQAN